MFLPAVYTIRFKMDDSGGMYVDGKRVSGADIGVVTTTTISNTCQILAAEVYNDLLFYVGLLLESTFGVVSDKTWRCVPRSHLAINEADLWKLPSFNDSTWPFAYELRKNKDEMSGDLLRLYEYDVQFAPDRQWITVDSNHRARNMCCRKACPPSPRP